MEMQHDKVRTLESRSFRDNVDNISSVLADNTIITVGSIYPPFALDNFK